MAALALLVATLLEDPVVRQRVEQDAQLRSAANDPAVQRQIATSATREQGMAGVYEIVSTLLSDAAVQARVQADPVLQALWADPAVRQLIQQRGRH